jgi:hypothetical protein
MASPGVYTDVFREQHGVTLADGLAAAPAAAMAGDFSQATTQAQRVVDAGQHLMHSVIRDALAAGLDGGRSASW